MNRSIRLATAILVAATPTLASADDIAIVDTQKTVAETVVSLTDAIEGAGAKVFATVDHGAGARSIDMDIGNSVLVIFGNPKIGTPAMKDNRLAGLHLPLKVLVFEDADGNTKLAWADPAGVFTQLDGIEDDAAYLEKMTGALRNMTGKAAE